MNLDYPFHIRLRQLMLDRGVTQVELARRTHMSRPCVHRWYWGIATPKISGLKAIRRALDCEWDELLGR